MEVKVHSTHRPLTYVPFCYHFIFFIDGCAISGLIFHQLHVSYPHYENSHLSVDARVSPLRLVVATAKLLLTSIRGPLSPQQNHPRQVPPLLFHSPPYPISQEISTSALQFAACHATASLPKTFYSQDLRSIMVLPSFVKKRVSLIFKHCISHLFHSTSRRNHAERYRSETQGLKNLNFCYQARGRLFSVLALPKVAK